MILIACLITLVILFLLSAESKLYQDAMLNVMTDSTSDLYTVKISCLT